jgi:hypothetical protein
LAPLPSSARKLKQLGDNWLARVDHNVSVFGMCDIIPGVYERSV